MKQNLRIEKEFYSREAIKKAIADYRHFGISRLLGVIMNPVKLSLVNLQMFLRMTRKSLGNF